MPLPRIVTVDPSWTLPRIVRAAADLLDRPLIQVDVPGSADALLEVSRGCTLLISTYEIDNDMKGFELALRVKRESPDTGVIILGDEDDPEDFDEETAADSPYIYLTRPVDVPKFVRILMAGIEGQDMKAIIFPQALPAPTINQEMGPIPLIDINNAQTIIDQLLIDLGAMAIVLAARDGKVLLERGAVGYLNREKLTASLLPAVLTAKDVKDLVGGQLSTMQFYDGEEYDVFMLSVGMHHFVCVVFDGQMGSRQLGSVNRYGRRAVEDMIALIGPAAFFIQPSVQVVEKEVRDKARREKMREEEEPVILAKADIAPADISAEPEPVFQLEPLADMDPNKLFGDPIADNMDDLFDLDKIDEELNQPQQGSKGKLSWDDAVKIGLLGGNS